MTMMEFAIGEHDSAEKTAKLSAFFTIRQGKNGPVTWVNSNREYIDMCFG